jgi:PIN domain nuclease of toxin-antitoxin system
LPSAPLISAPWRLCRSFTDPFDRILVAQAIAEGLTLATKDAVLVRYGVLGVWD